MDGGAVKSRMSDAAELDPSDEGKSGPEKRSCDEELRIGPNDGHNEVRNRKNCGLKRRDEDRKVKFQDGKKNGNDNEGIDKPEEGSKKREQGDDETNFDEQREDRKSVEKIGEAGKASNFGDPNRWVLDKRHHGGGGWRV